MAGTIRAPSEHGDHHSHHSRHDRDREVIKEKEKIVEKEKITAKAPSRHSSPPRQTHNHSHQSHHSDHQSHHSDHNSDHDSPSVPAPAIRAKTPAKVWCTNRPHPSRSGTPEPKTSQDPGSDATVPHSFANVPTGHKPASAPTSAGTAPAKPASDPTSLANVPSDPKAPGTTATAAPKPAAQEWSTNQPKNDGKERPEHVSHNVATESDPANDSKKAGKPKDKDDGASGPKVPPLPKATPAKPPPPKTVQFAEEPDAHEQGGFNPAGKTDGKTDGKTGIKPDGKGDGKVDTKKTAASGAPTDPLANLIRPTSANEIPIYERIRLPNGEDALVKIGSMPRPTPTETPKKDAKAGGAPAKDSASTGSSSGPSKPADGASSSEAKDTGKSKDPAQGKDAAKKDGNLSPPVPRPASRNSVKEPTPTGTLIVTNPDPKDEWLSSAAGTDKPLAGKPGRKPVPPVASLSDIPQPVDPPGGAKPSGTSAATTAPAKPDPKLGKTGKADAAGAPPATTSAGGATPAAATTSRPAAAGGPTSVSADPAAAPGKTAAKPAGPAATPPGPAAAAPAASGGGPPGAGPGGQAVQSLMFPPIHCDHCCPNDARPGLQPPPKQPADKKEERKEDKKAEPKKDDGKKDEPKKPEEKKAEVKKPEEKIEKKDPPQHCNNCCPKELRQELRPPQAPKPPLPQPPIEKAPKKDAEKKDGEKKDDPKKDTEAKKDEKKDGDKGKAKEGDKVVEDRECPALLSLTPAAKKKAEAEKKELEERHKALVTCFETVMNEIRELIKEQKEIKTLLEASNKDKVERRKVNAERDKKVKEALDKLTSEEAAEAKKSGTQAVLDALKSSNEAHSKFIRDFGVELMEHMADQHKATQDSSKGWAKEQVAFNISG